MPITKDSLTIHDCDISIVNQIEYVFLDEEYRGIVDIIVKKKIGQLDNTITIQISWEGEEKQVDLFTKIANYYIKKIMET